MAVFIELVEDVGSRSFSNLAKGFGRAGMARVRRPLMGFETKQNTYAVLRIIKADGTEIMQRDGGAHGGTTAANANFLLQSVSQARQERMHVLETFSDAYVYFFGEQPKFFDCQALLFDTPDFNWSAEWWHNYDQYLRGSKCVEVGARLFLFFEDTIVSGYMMQAQASKTQGAEFAQLSFRLFVTDYHDMSFVGEGSPRVQPDHIPSAESQLLQESGFDSISNNAPSPARFVNNSTQRVPYYLNSAEMTENPAGASDTNEEINQQLSSAESALDSLDPEAFEVPNLAAMPLPVYQQLQRGVSWSSGQGYGMLSVSSPQGLRQLGIVGSSTSSSGVGGFFGTTVLSGTASAGLSAPGISTGAQAWASLSASATPFTSMQTNARVYSGVSPTLGAYAGASASAHAGVFASAQAGAIASAGGRAGVPFSSWGGSYGAVASINPLTGQVRAMTMSSPVMPGVTDSYGRPVSPMGHLQALERAVLGPGASLFRQYMGLPSGMLEATAGGSVQAPLPSNVPSARVRAAAAAAVASAKASTETGVAAAVSAGAKMTQSDAAQLAAAQAAATAAQAAANAAAAASAVSAFVPGRPAALPGGMNF